MPADTPYTPREFEELRCAAERRAAYIDGEEYGYAAGYHDGREKGIGEGLTLGVIIFALGCLIYYVLVAHA